jgi:DNA-binding NtrC family response regulator
MTPLPPASARTIIGSSLHAAKLRRQIEKAGKIRWPVLLMGETGTGKEVAARLIHSVLNSGPFITVDCSSMVGPLMESELFGHERGSFTGAVKDKPGLLEEANGGTAFLDEIGELPLDLQAKLLRALQEKEFRRVGSVNTRRSDFRVISATNRDLAAEVEKGTFRADLFYRLNVYVVRLTPLRERREDIPDLIHHFLQKNDRLHLMTPDLLQALVAYDWPGNIRELENCLHHMMAATSGPVFQQGDLPTTVRNAAALSAPVATMSAAAGVGAAPAPALRPVLFNSTPFSWDAPAAPPSGPPPDPPQFPAPLRFDSREEAAADDDNDIPLMPLAELEKRAILKAIEHTNGDRARAASLLGIGRTTLYRKLKEYGFDDEEEKV